MMASDDGTQMRRKAAMAVLGHSTAAEIARYLDRIALPGHENLREPEHGVLHDIERVLGITSRHARHDERAPLDRREKAFQLTR